ncbi:MAG: ATP-binding protein [Isosphaeraceae bacterium]
MESTLTVEREPGIPPQVYREGVRELSDSSILQRIEIYSQGDLQLIAQDDRLRLDLIDRPHKVKVDEYKARRARHAQALQELGPQIRAKRIEIESKRAEVRMLEGLRGQLAEIQRDRPKLSDELDRERAAHLERTAFLERLERTVAARKALLDNVSTALSAPDVPAEVLGELEGLNLPEAGSLKELLGYHRDFIAETREAVSEAIEQDADGLLSRLRSHFEELSATYYQLRQAQQAVNDTLKREDALKQQIEHLERQQAILERMEDDVKELTVLRQEHREEIRQINDKICVLRFKEVDAINARHSEVIILTLEQGVRSPGYAEKLGMLLKGSNLRSQAEVVKDLSEKVRPPDLVDIVEKSDAQRLATALGRDVGQMTRLIAHIADSPALYELDGIVFEDRLEITMYDDGVLKPVGQLSKGQMATALLPLILRAADYPLIFDQPEDDLDNRFVYKTLVEIVRNLKHERQLIFVTHNANIPVLGEADRVVVMQMETPLAAAPPISGAVDEVKEHILNLLEGGKEAFRQRQEKYQALLGE